MMTTNRASLSKAHATDRPASAPRGVTPDIVDRLSVADGMSLRWAHWRRQVLAPAGNVVLLGGRGEFMEKYGEVAGELLDRGFEVWSLDWRGQGLSGRYGADAAQGHIDRFETYLADLDAFLTGPAAERRGETLVLAHSMGGHLALRHAGEGTGVGLGARSGERIGRGADLNANGVDRLVLVAPMVDIAFPRHLRPVVRACARAARGVGMGRHYAPGQRALAEVERVEESRRTKDAARLARERDLIAREPGLWLGGVSYGWLAAAFDSIAALEAEAEAVHVPTLIVGAGRDSVVCNQAQRRLAARLPQGRHLEIEDALHEVLMERDDIRRRFWSAFDAFAGRRLCQQTPLSGSRVG